MKSKFAVAIAAILISVGAGAQTSSTQGGKSDIAPNPPIGTGTIDTDQGTPGAVHNGSSKNTSNSSMSQSRSSKAQRSKSSGTANCAGGTGNNGGASNAGNADGSAGGNPDCRSSSDQTKRTIPPASVGQTNAGTANGSDNDPARK